MDKRKSDLKRDFVAISKLGLAGFLIAWFGFLSGNGELAKQCMYGGLFLIVGACVMTVFVRLASRKAKKTDTNDVEAQA